MSKTKKLNEAIKISNAVIEGIQEKKGKEIVTLDLRTLKNAVAEYFIVCHGESRTQVEAIANSIEEEVYKKIKENPWHKEGYENAEWILLDYINVVVHIFQKDKRDFYGVERLWADADIQKISNSY